MASMSVSGVVSGMDWESMIDSIIETAAAPAQPKVNKKTNLTNKKSLLEEMKVTMNSLQSSLSTLKLPSTYKAKEIEIERIDKTGSYKGVLTATVNADAEINVWDVKVNQLATAQTNRSKQITSSTLSSTLNGLSSSMLYINMGGQKVGINVNASDSLQTLKSRINTTLKTLDNPMAITASVVDNKLILKSDNTGLGTLSNSETINYNMTGVNKLSTMSISDDDVDKVSIYKGTSKYTIHKDYTIVNGNEIRWKQYDRSNEVNIGGTAEVKYTMSADDVYEASGTYGTSEAEISGFSMTDNGTLSKRVKIVDANNVEYTYGEDFTIKDGKVVWLEEEEATTNEPDSYTVSYSKTTSESYSAEGEKTSATSTPTSYSVQYTNDILSSTSLTYGRHDTGYSYINVTAGSLTTFSGMTNLDGISSVTSAAGKTYLTFDDDSEPSININGTDYVYGRDYVIRKGASSDEMFLVPYTIYTSEIDDYLAAAGKTMPDGVQISPQNDIIAGSAGSLSYSHTTAIDSTDQTAITNLLNNSSTDLSKIVILKSDGTEYTEGTDYHISGGEIVWTLPNDSTDITMAQFAELQTKYAEAYEVKHGTTSELSTVTLIDGDGVLRTYVDPDDPDILTMSAGGNDYVYGRDYVLRVNDSGTGYRFDWLVEDSDTITDASKAVTTYAAYKNISTSEWQAAPAEGTAYTFGFDYDVTTTTTGTVKSSDTDKSLATVLDGTTIDSSDYGEIVIKDSSGNEYTYGTDWTIDSAGSITWLEQNSNAPSSYTATYTTAQVDITPDSGKSKYDSLSSGTTFPKIDTLMGYGFEVADVPGGSRTVRTIDVYNPSSTQDYKFEFSLKNSDGSYTVSDDYVYGRDYTVRKFEDVSNPSIHTLIAFYNRAEVRAYADLVTSDTSTYGDIDLSGTPLERPDDDYRLSLIHTAASTNASSLSSLISEASGNYDGITITGSNGVEYSYSSANPEDLTDNTFTIVDGVITFKPSTAPTRPDTGTSYTLIYEAFDALTATGTYDDEATQQEAAITVDSGYGNISGNKLSYEQILKDLSLTSSSTDDDIAEKFAENFTLTDEYGDSYTYGEDFTITQGTDTDSTTGEHKLMITWLEDGNQPYGDFTLTYTGRGEGGGEVVTTDGVTRSANDTINPASSDITRALYSDFNSAKEIRITDGTETYFKGVDFTVGNDGSGNAVINWITASPGTADYATYFEDATSITVTASDGTEITGYTISAGSNGEAVFTMDDGTTLDADTYTVKVVKDGYTKLYDLTSDGTNMEITRRSAWQSQDNTKSASYDIYVTPANGKTTTYTGTRTAGSYNFSIDTIAYPSASDFENGTTTITQGSKTFYEGIDFDITDDDNGRATIEWISDDDGGTEWYYPVPGSSYTINYTDSNGNTTSRTAYRSSIDTLRMSDYGLTTAKGSISFKYGDDLSYKLDAEPDYEVDDDGEYMLDDEGNKIPIANTDGRAAIKKAYAVDVTTNSNGSFYFNWQTPELTSRTDLPSYGDELTVEYEYDANTFTLSGDAADLLGLNDDVTEAQDAELEVDGEKVYRASNYIGADYDNELIKGVTMQLKGVGEVSLDISHDAEKAVTSIQTFVDTYNDLMTWMNTRMTESQVDEDTAATIDSDDFRMRWGLLHGSSLLRQTKSQMRNLTSQNFTFSFTQRKSSEEIYGTMAHNGLKSSSTLRLRIGTKYVDVTIDPTDTLETIVAKINDDTRGGAMNDIYYDDNGNKLQSPLLKASVENDMLVINSTSSDEITMSGSAAMNALKMNYTYKGLYQIGIASTSEDYGKSGGLEFDADEFMTALEDNPDEVQALMLKFVGEFDTWTKSMLNSSATGETSGTLTREIENIQSQIDSINEYLENYQDRLDRMEESLRSKYASTETSLSRLSQQANSIAAILNQLNGTASGGGYGQTSS